MDTSKFDRFKDAVWFPGKEEHYIMIGGAGGIGSWTALMLARAGFKLVVYDFDTLDPVNMAGQLFPTRLIGKKKVRALAEVIKDFADEVITPMDDIINEDTPSHHYVISAFDNMKARKDMFESWTKVASVNPNALFIDGRLTAEQMWIFCVTPDRIEDYRKHLFDDSEIEDTVCTMKQTSHAAAMIASHITGFFTNHFTNIRVGEKIREVPFCYEYFIPMNLVNTDL